MEHTDARNTNATERYLLEEMPAVERDAFEEHFFDCSECSADVRDGARMMAAGRQVAAEGATVHRIDGWRGWLPKAVAVSALFATLGYYGGAMRPALPMVAEVQTYQIATEAERSSGAATLVIPAGELAAIDFDIPPADDATSYVVRVEDAAGKTMFETIKSLEEAANPISLSLRALPRGSYRVVIEGVRKGGNRFPVSNSVFQVGER
jgi:hypothetical protein